MIPSYVVHYHIVVFSPSGSLWAGDAFGDGQDNITVVIDCGIHESKYNVL